MGAGRSLLMECRGRWYFSFYRTQRREVNLRPAGAAGRTRCPILPQIKIGNVWH